MTHRIHHRIQLIATILGALALAAFTGCAADVPEEETGALSEGLTVLEAGDGVLSLAYRAGDDLIFMESLRGQPTPEPYQQAEDQPDFELDARFTSDDGSIFYSARGGDHWLEPTWVEEIEAQQDQRPEGSNEKWFRLATDAAAIMHEELELQLGADRVAELAPEIEAIHSFAEQALDVYHEQNRNFIDAIREREGLPPLVEGDSGGDVAYGTSGPEDADWYRDTDGYYALGVHDKDLYEFGRHSATQLLYWNSGWVTVHNNCNHGTCASSMGVKCYMQYYHTDATNYWETDRMYQQSCDSYYHWKSNDDHNCHDDTRVQMYNKFYGRSIGGWSYWCNDGDSDADISVGVFGLGDHSGSPECSSSREKGWNHIWM